MPYKPRRHGKVAVTRRRFSKAMRALAASNRSAPASREPANITGKSPPVPGDSITVAKEPIIVAQNSASVADSHVSNAFETSNDTISQPLVLPFGTDIDPKDDHVHGSQIVPRHDGARESFDGVRLVGKARGREDSLQALRLDYHMEGLPCAEYSSMDRSHPLYPEFYGVSNSIDAFYDEQEILGHDADASESGFVNRILHIVMDAVRAKHQGNRNQETASQTSTNPGVCLPDKFDILAIRYLGLDSLNGRIASMLASLKRVDLMVIGDLHPPKDSQDAAKYNAVCDPETRLSRLEWMRNQIQGDLKILRESSSSPSLKGAFCD